MGQPTSKLKVRQCPWMHGEEGRRGVQVHSVAGGGSPKHLVLQGDMWFRGVETLGTR